MKAPLTVGLLLVVACEPPTPGPPSKPPPLDRCEGLAPIVVTASPARVKAQGAATLEATGGTGRYTFSVETAPSGGTVSGARYVAGAASGTDVIRATDDCEYTGSTRIEVQPSFDVQPSRATVRPGTRFTIRVRGATGPVTLTPSGGRLASGGSVSGSGDYLAGATEGLDLIIVRDTATGDQTLLQFRVSTTARFRVRPSKMAVPTGGSIPLETADGSGAVSWRMTSMGPGTLTGSTFVAPAMGSGTATLEATDLFTQETAKASIRILDELTRPTRAQGRRTDLATLVTLDFDGDGLRDVALGVPESDLGRPLGGAVFLFKGTSTGLPDKPTWEILGTSDTGQLGAVMAVGDLDGDGKDDLAISEPGADVTIADSGAVLLYRIGPDGPQRLRAPLTGLGRGNFGAALDIADVDGDGDGDLIVGSPGADLAPSAAINARGIVDVFLLDRGLPIPDLGTIRLGGQDLAADGTFRVAGQLRAGRSVVARDVNGDGRVDLAMVSTVNNALVGGVALARAQIAIQIHLGRAGANPFDAKPDAFVVPINPSDTGEGTWRLGFIPASSGFGPFLVAAADQMDSPNLMASGGNAALVNAGGALLYDLRMLRPLSAEKPAQLGRADAFAQLYGDQAGIQAGRSFAVADLDRDGSPELLLGAPFATATLTKGGMAVSIARSGKILGYPLAPLTRGAQLNKPPLFRAGERGDALGVAVAWLGMGDSARLLGYAGRASTMLGDFTGRLDAYAGMGTDLSTWTAAAVAIRNAPASQQFGVAVDLAPTQSGLQVLVGVPGLSGAAPETFGDEISAGQVMLFGGTTLELGRVLQEGSNGNAVSDAGVRAFGGRSLGIDVTMTDFDGDGRQDAVFGAPGFVAPARLADGGAPLDYAGARPECFGSTPQSTGGAFVHVQRPDGTFREAFRVWAPGIIADCVVPDGGAASVCQRSGLSRNGLAGGFDFNGDGTQDLALTRLGGLEVMLGRRADDPALAKPSAACDSAFSFPTVAAGTAMPVALGDLNDDGCAEVGMRYGDRLGVFIIYGFDASGARCGGRTTASWIRLSAEAEVGAPTIRLGVAMARAGPFVAGDRRDFVAITADAFSFEGVSQPTVLLYDSAQLNARRPTSGSALVGALGDGLEPVPLVYLERAPGFGRQLWGNVDVTGDGKPDLIVSAPGASLNGDGTGAVFVFAGGQGVIGRNEPAMTVFPDQRERAAFGQDLAATHAVAPNPAALVIGAPLSYRSGTSNGTAYVLKANF
jgi:hypothetical protein